MRSNTAHARALHRLSLLHDAPLNFEPPTTDIFADAVGWRIDAYRQPLPAEMPGQPQSGGSWELARECVTHYEFADPSLIRAVYNPEQALMGRTLLLIGRFGPMRFHMGARVYEVVDETRVVDGREVRVWGWGYQTLRGHLETGRMRFQVWKWLDDGRVEFRLDAASRPAHIENVVVRMGFSVFGRRLQVRFAQMACDRVATLVGSRLKGRGDVVAPTALNTPA
ncbi:MAG: hypothetical protein JWN41_833 [Thermoleophilia bacterium]|nr:hypothetical protein [Thermoleophilia bacterium]